MAHACATFSLIEAMRLLLHSAMRFMSWDKTKISFLTYLQKKYHLSLMPRCVISILDSNKSEKITQPDSRLRQWPYFLLCCVSDMAFIEGCWAFSILTAFWLLIYGCEFMDWPLCFRLARPAAFYTTLLWSLLFLISRWFIN